jgi:hypothetical protein
MIQVFLSNFAGMVSLPGPPISKNSAIMELISNNVVVGIGCEEIWSARNLPFDIAWVRLFPSYLPSRPLTKHIKAAIESGGRLSKEEAFAIGSTNLLKLLGVEVDDAKVDLVASRGADPFGFDSKVVSVLSPRQNSIHIFQE